MNFAVGEKERRGQVIRHAFIPELLELRKVEGTIGVCKAPTDRFAAGVNLSNRTTAEFRGFEQVERSVQYFNLRSGPPNEPTAHDVRMQGAHEHRYTPERNAAADKPVTQLCDHVVGLHRRSRTIDEPIHSRPYFASRHRSAFVCKLRWALIVALLLHCVSPLLAQSRHVSRVAQCPLLGAKRTSNAQE